jgi:hypothetical protein
MSKRLETTTKKGNGDRDAYRVKELAARTGLSEAYWWQKIKEKKVRTVAFGKAVLVPVDEYQRVLTEGF